MISKPPLHILDVSLFSDPFQLSTNELMIEAGVLD